MSNRDVSSVEEDVEALMRQALSKSVLEIQWDEDCYGLFAHVDAFLELSKGNNIVEEVQLDPFYTEIAYGARMQTGRRNWAGL
jgi:hypothetical protein